MCAVLGACAAEKPPLGGGDVDSAGAADDGSTRAGGASLVGEGFAAADADPVREAEKAKQLRAARDVRWKALEGSLRKADAKTMWERGEEQQKSQNWKNAQDAFEALVVFSPRDAHAPKAVELAMRMAFRRGERA